MRGMRDGGGVGARWEARRRFTVNPLDRCAAACNSAVEVGSGFRCPSSKAHHLFVDISRYPRRFSMVPTAGWCSGMHRSEQAWTGKPVMYL